MAEIDKALPNEVRKEVNIPSEEDLQVELEQQPEEKGPVEVQENEDEARERLRERASEHDAPN